MTSYASTIASNRDITSFAFFRSRNHNPLTAQFYPDGFVPQINQYSRDRSLLAGLKGSSEGGFNWDSYSYGYNKIDFHTRNTVNYSLGGGSPTSFYDGALEYTQNMLNARISPSNFSSRGLAIPSRCPSVPSIGKRSGTSLRALPTRTSAAAPKARWLHSRECGTR